MATLFIVATPIGNMDDISIRAINTLQGVDCILCEDTRHTGLLLQKIQCSTPMLSYYDEIEEKRLPEVIGLLEEGKSVALVSDAGTPLISDPGFRLVRECVKRNIPVISIPGPSAVITSLSISGLPPDKFMFLGYPSEKSSHRIKQFEDLLSIHRCISTTFIYYCAPHKLIQTLTDMQSVYGDITIVIARELTKIHEELWRGKISKSLTHFSKPQGEFVILYHL